MLISPSWATQFPKLIVGQSTRLGGVSPAPYTSLNLGTHTQDTPSNVEANRQLLAERIGISTTSWAGGYQIHGAEIMVINGPMICEGYDAFITQQTGVLLTVTVADCLPILIYDPINEAYGAAHAGWRGTVAQIAAKTLAAMVQRFSTSPEKCYAYIGAGISRPNFEVSRDVAEQFSIHLVD
ncbi:MAG: polyphenol oxidase family protein, partial [Bacteroidota bacterium]